MNESNNNPNSGTEQPLPTDSELLREYFQWLKTLQSAHRQFAEPLSADSGYSTSVEFIDKGLVWQQYHLQVDLYKHYLDLVIKFNAFYYAITGAFLSYYLSNFSNDLVRWGLVFPVIMSIFFSGLFLKASRSVKYLDEELEHICMLFGFTRPETKILTLGLVASGVLFGAIGLALAIVFIIRT